MHFHGPMEKTHDINTQSKISYKRYVKLHLENKTLSPNKRVQNTVDTCRMFCLKTLLFTKIVERLTGDARNTSAERYCRFIGK